MNRPKLIFVITLVFSAIFVGATVSFAQGDNRQRVEPSYEVSLQVIVGSNDAGQRGELPANLAAISKGLRSSFAFSNYRLASTFLGRISDTGTFQYKSVSNVLGQEVASASPTFLDWTLENFRSMPSEKGPTAFQAQGFRFGARVPVVTGNFLEGTGKGNPVINYEAIGVTVSKVGVFGCHN